MLLASSSVSLVRLSLRKKRYLHAGGASQLAVHVVAANLHIVCGTNPPKVSVRQHIMKQKRVFLEKFTGIDQNMLGGTA